jgi:hypothetical protein
MVQWPLQPVQPGDAQGVVPLKKGGGGRNVFRSPGPDLHNCPRSTSIHRHIVHEQEASNHDSPSTRRHAEGAVAGFGVVHRVEVENPFNIRYEITG